MTNYNKLKNSELDLLLKLRGLPSDGNKIQRVARLAKQDQEDEAEAKATNAGVKAASTGSNQQAESALETRRQARKTQKGKGLSQRSVFNSDGQSTERGEADNSYEYDGQVNSLMGGSSSARHFNPTKENGYKGIIVAPSTPTSVAARDAKVNKEVSKKAPAQLVNNAVEEEKDEDLSSDARAATICIIAALLPGILVAFFLGGYTMEDIRGGVVDGIKDPVGTMKEGILGSEGSNHKDLREAFGGRLVELWGLATGKMKEWCMGL